MLLRCGFSYRPAKWCSQAVAEELERETEGEAAAVAVAFPERLLRSPVLAPLCRHSCSSSIHRRSHPVHTQNGCKMATEAIRAVATHAKFSLQRQCDLQQNVTHTAALQPCVASQPAQQSLGFGFFSHLMLGPETSVLLMNAHSSPRTSWSFIHMSGGSRACVLLSFTPAPA